jgi:hypothetical protein
MAATVAAVVTIALIGSGMIHRPQPPPLAADVGLPPARELAARPEPASSKPPHDHGQPEGRQSELRERRPAPAASSAARRSRRGRSRPSSGGDQTASPARPPSVPAPVPTAAAQPPMAAPVIAAAPIAATPASPAAPPPQPRRTTPREFGFEH